MRSFLLATALPESLTPKAHFLLLERTLVRLLDVDMYTLLIVVLSALTFTYMNCVQQSWLSWLQFRLHRHALMACQDDQPDQITATSSLLVKRKIPAVTYG